ncbi:MAG: peptidoglycan DD-metalloendopeptidase family protein [Actinomycetota bacterium]|nr:peptidoglycan DD-metalloendopeptidase family protein [Actinomycetota bacterium]
MLTSASIRRMVLGALLVSASGINPARAEDSSEWLIPPVDGAIARPWLAPETDWGSGHRGLDYASPPGTAVRAAAAGTVTFAGAVAGIEAVTIDHGDGLATSYSALGAIHVAEGQQVGAGAWIGTVGEAHTGTGSGLHLSVRLGGEYVDPRAYMGATDVSDAIHLAPLLWEPPRSFAEPLRAALDHGTAGMVTPGCSLPPPLDHVPTAPPNDNIAVAVAGIASQTARGTGAEMYENGPELLGYDPSDVYRFSYRGSRDHDLHEEYERTDTYGDLDVAARRLRDLLAAIARRHPGRAVDLVAHSQGGVVARRFLSHVATEWATELPRIAHLVTFATPHTGAPLAANISTLQERTITGEAALQGASWLSSNGVPIPDPLSPAAAQLAPDSEFMTSMASEDVLFGTRVLALATPNDVVVPADRALYPGHQSRVVAPSGINGHAAIVSSGHARALAHSFLGDGAPACTTSWDGVGPGIGRAVGWLERQITPAWAAAEAAAIDRLTGVPRAGTKAQSAWRLLRRETPTGW